MKRAVIFAGGEMEPDFFWKPEQDGEWLIICADGGLRHAKRLGVMPNVIIGDCDSSKEPYPKEIPHILYPSEKDETDTRLCLDWAMEQGCKEVLILGGLGGRLDHEFSNYNLLLYGLNHGVKVTLANAKNEIFMLDRSAVLKPKGKKYISFFPYGGKVEGFSLRGFKYEAEDMTLTCDTVLTACNEFLGDACGEVCFQSGHLLVMLCED